MESKEISKVDDKKLVELDAVRKAKQQQHSSRKPVCTDGVCTLNWKPIKPAA